MVCNKITDSDNTVQEAATTALIHVIEQGPVQTLNNMNVILETFERVIDHVKGAALIGILDDIG